MLSTLDISHNQLSQFPDSFYTIRSLINVDISHNKISGAVDLQAFKQLESLNIRNKSYLLAIYVLPPTPSFQRLLMKSSLSVFIILI